MPRIRVLIHSNYSAVKTGFGKVMRYVLTQLYRDEEIELIEAANGMPFGADLKRPWKAHGTMEVNTSFLSSIEHDEWKKRANHYGFYCIDKIVEKEKPDLYIGLEDPWAFNDYVKKDWFHQIPTIIWSPIDSLPVADIAKLLATKADRFLTCATFASKAMREDGLNVDCLHQPIDLDNFKPLEDRAAIRARHNIGPENFVAGFVFKNQLRKSVFSLLGAFREFQKRNDNKGRLILHTDWSEKDGTSWDIPGFLKEYKVNPEHVLATYICKACRQYSLLPYNGEDKDCPHCRQKALVTKTCSFGVDEIQLNEIYNCMDVYVHPFTSGGQELPLQEAKAAGLITLVNDYSCGTDAAYEEQGGMTLEWCEYKEPHSNFSKAAVSQKSILDNLERVYKFSPAARAMYGNWARKYALENYHFTKVIPKLKEIILETAKIKKEKLAPNPSYIPDDSLTDENWVIDMFRNLVGIHVKAGDMDYEHTLGLIRKDRGERAKIAGHLRAELLKGQNPSFEDLLDKEGKDNRIAVVIPESAGDVLMVNSLLSNLKELYPAENLYVITKDSFVPMIDDHPAIHKIVPFQNGIDNLLYLEGQWEHAGFFKIAFLPHIITQKYFGYHHNGLTKYQFELRD